jgi:hypothetical protein
LGLAVARFCSLFFAALALAPALAHLLELPNKLGLSRADYLTVQQIYRGWAWLGVVVVGALLSTLALTIILRQRGRGFGLALLAFLCIAGTQVVFWTFTFPVNRQTMNWSVMPDAWTALRAQWEYSHAAAAALNFVAFVALIVSTLVTDRPPATGGKIR